MSAPENKMGVMPVKKLIINMSLPMMISMLVQAMYNIVDSIFVSMLSEEALTAVTLAFPIQNLMIAVGTGTGVGINALLSRSLGEKNFDRADEAANNGIALALVSYAIFVVIGLLAVRPFINSQTANPVIQEYGIIYTSIVCFLSIGVFFQITFERLLQSTGRTLFSMISQITGAVINIIMDPILIFGLAGFPRLGIAGAAAATIFGQIVASCIGLFLNCKYNRDIHISLKRVLHPVPAVIGQIYRVGIPSILMVSIGSVMTYMMNRILEGFSSTAVAVFGVYFKLQSFVFMPVFGLNNGLVPVMAYNLGAAKEKRIREALSFSLIVAVCIMVGGAVLFELIPARLLSIFNASETMTAIGVPALREIALCFPIAAVAIVLSSVFQAFSCSIYSLIVSICRQLVVLIPAAWLLSKTGNVANVWWSYLIAEAVSLALTVFFFRIVWKKMITEGLRNRAE